MPLTARFGIEEEYVLLDARALVPLSATALKDGLAAIDGTLRTRVLY